MGRIKTKLVKGITLDMLEEHRSKFTNDYQKNKEVIKKLYDIPSKKISNTIAGYVTRLVKEK